MPPAKRKAADDGIGRASKRSTPAPATPQSVDSLSDDDYAESEDEGLDEEGGKIKLSAAQAQRQKDQKAAITKLNKRTQFSRISRLTGKSSRLFGQKDFHDLGLKKDHENRPIWIDARVSEGSSKGPKITLESFAPNASKATDLLTTIAEPVSRPAHLHEYRLTEHSLYAALSVGLKGDDIINALEKFCKTNVPDGIKAFIERNTLTYGKVRFVLRDNKFYVESEDDEVIYKLLTDSVISGCKAAGAEVQTGTIQTKATVIQGTAGAKGQTQVSQQQGEIPRDDPAAENEAMIQALRDEDDDEDSFRQTHSFEIAKGTRETVAQRCLEIGLPGVSEYDFNNDKNNPNLPIDLKPQTQIRPYQEKALSKMFGNGRGKSGIIVLPCGAGKTLVGITAACHIKKKIVVLCTSAMSVYQWASEFKKWSDVRDEDVTSFSSSEKKKFPGEAGILVSTYSMMCIDPEGPRCAYDTKNMLQWVQSQEWGLMILDEVHVVPAKMFRKVQDTVRAHCKLGLTATLLREDDKITDLNYLIGPKLYEANWMELANQGHIAKVQCAEVWCPMSMEFYQEYQKASSRKQLLYYACNPIKFQVCQFLINYHENRGDKIIVFSDNIFALEHYAKAMMKPFIHGQTSNKERQDVLENFQHNEIINTIFLSKIGDTSLDLPEATCLIQISSHYGSRRQEAQRLGRILRAKRRNDEGFNAFFYSLVSKDTTEMAYSAKRQAFLVDQGYSFKTITHLQGMDQMPNLMYKDPRERMELLSEVMLVSEDQGDLEKGANNLWATDKGPRGRGSNKKKGLTGVRRTAGSLAEMGGGGIMAPIYQERQRGAQTADKNSFFEKEKRRRTALEKKRRAEASK
ncbi:DNA repair helicase RAD25 [Knufia obscura]|uniref:DNA 3'-5' helicase n=2 Tax=Knufia TaxID=430999 RepID=A0AAN8I1R2_9EURO|nr:DNA repair helicase RAD25 [Knufia obscura]KAK5949652.1 DNA repair helicase RAD25 [Knufia fluminis]